MTLNYHILVQNDVKLPRNNWLSVIFVEYSRAQMKLQEWFKFRPAVEDYDKLFQKDSKRVYNVLSYAERTLSAMNGIYEGLYILTIKYYSCGVPRYPIESVTGKKISHIHQHWPLYSLLWLSLPRKLDLTEDAKFAVKVLTSPCFIVLQTSLTYTEGCIKVSDNVKIWWATAESLRNVIYSIVGLQQYGWTTACWTWLECHPVIVDGQQWLWTEQFPISSVKFQSLYKRPTLGYLSFTAWYETWHLRLVSLWNHGASLVIFENVIRYLWTLVFTQKRVDRRFEYSASPWSVKGPMMARFAKYWSWLTCPPTQYKPVASFYHAVWATCTTWYVDCCLWAPPKRVHLPTVVNSVFSALSLNA